MTKAAPTPRASPTEADLLRLLHHAVDLDRPRPQLEGLRRLDHVLARAEFIEKTAHALQMVTNGSNWAGKRPSVADVA